MFVAIFLRGGNEMDLYYVHDGVDNKGQHEVHKYSCSWLPNDKTFLGYYSNSKEAVAKAKTIYTNSDGCCHCCQDADTD